MILCLHNADTLNICMKEFGSKYNIDNMVVMRTSTFSWIVSKSGYACVMIGHIRAHQLTPQLLMELFDTLTT